MKKYYEEFIGNENFAQKLEERSAIKFVDELPSIPYLILHGGNDDIISPLQSINISKKFYSLNIAHRLVIFENDDHYLKSHKKEVDELRKLWYKKYHN
jgi:dipeptidyl aminopeptidase/acylaminoacyl peptidase